MLNKGRRCRPIDYANSDRVALNRRHTLEVLIDPLANAINLSEHNVIQSVEIYTSVEVRTVRTMITDNSLLCGAVNAELLNRGGLDVRNSQEHDVRK